MSPFSSSLNTVCSSHGDWILTQNVCQGFWHDKWIYGLIWSPVRFYGFNAKPIRSKHLKGSSWHKKAHSKMSSTPAKQHNLTVRVQVSWNRWHLPCPYETFQLPSSMAWEHCLETQLREIWEIFYCFLMKILFIQELAAFCHMFL